jgi:DNA-directed RNA polymerase subunit M/transcription elongation factor TFIIS
MNNRTGPYDIGLMAVYVAYRTVRAVVRLKIAYARLRINGWREWFAGANKQTSRYNLLNDAVCWAEADIFLPARWQDREEMATCPACGHHTHYLNGTATDATGKLGNVFACPRCTASNLLTDVLPEPATDTKATSKLPRPLRAARAVVRLWIARAALSVTMWREKRAGITGHTERFDRRNGDVGWALADRDLPARWQDREEMATCPACGHHTHHLNGANLNEDGTISFVFTCPSCRTDADLLDVLPDGSFRDHLTA